MPYHHGTLRPALLDAALALARAGGPDDVALRAATRTAGVSHNAAYRHFADRDDLLDAVRQECLRRLGILMQRRLAELAADVDPVRDAWNRLEAAGCAYVEFALEEPGWFRTAFSAAHGKDVPPAAASPGTPVSERPYDILGMCLDGLVSAGGLSPERRPDAELPAWAAVHGLAGLLLDGPLQALGADERAAAVRRVVTSVGRAF